MFSWCRMSWSHTLHRGVLYYWDHQVMSKMSVSWPEIGQFFTFHQEERVLAALLKFLKLPPTTSLGHLEAAIPSLSTFARKDWIDHLQLEQGWRMICFAHHSDGLTSHWVKVCTVDLLTWLQHADEAQDLSRRGDSVNLSFYQTQGKHYQDEKVK